MNTIQELVKFQEGWRPYLYDDETGQAIVPGYTVKGHPTIGWGFRLDMLNALLPADCDPILNRKINEQLAKLVTFPWYTILEQDGGQARTFAVIDLAYQIGAEDIDHKFVYMKAAIMGRDWATAADEIENSEAGSLERRAYRAYMMRTNQWPP